LFLYFNATGSASIYTLSLHDALPILLSFTIKFALSAVKSLENHLPSTIETPKTSAKFSSTAKLVNRGCVSGLFLSHSAFTVPFTRLVGRSETIVNRDVKGFRSNSLRSVRYFDHRSPFIGAYTRFSLSNPRFLSCINCSWLYTTPVPTSRMIEIANCTTTSVFRNVLPAAPARRLPCSTLEGRKPERNKAG